MTKHNFRLHGFVFDFLAIWWRHFADCNLSSARENKSVLCKVQTNLEVSWFECFKARKTWIEILTNYICLQITFQPGWKQRRSTYNIASNFILQQNGIMYSNYYFTYYEIELRNIFVILFLWCKISFS